MKPSRKTLWERYNSKRDINTRNLLVEEYLHLVKYQIEKINIPLLIDKQDIYQAGVLGLIDAFDKYQTDKNAEFESYASFRIKGEMMDFLRKYGKVTQGVSRSTIKVIKELEKIQREIESEKNGKATEQEIMEHMKINEKELSNLRFRTQIFNGISLESYYENPSLQNDSYNIEKQILQDEASKEVENYIAELKEKEKFVINNFYFKQKNKKLIAEEMGVSEARISQIHQEGINKLRNLLNKE